MPGTTCSAPGRSSGTPRRRSSTSRSWRRGTKMTGYRVEKDSMGEVRVPAKAYYGAQSQRAAENFPVSGHGMPMSVVHAVALVKGLAAEVNAGLGILPAPLAEAISRAAREVLEGTFDDQF